MSDSFILDPKVDPERLNLHRCQTPSEILTTLLYHTKEDLSKAATLLKVSETQFIMELQRHGLLRVH